MKEPGKYNTIDSTCKFCGSEIHLEIHEACPPLDVDYWKSIAGCNRCADAKRIIYEHREKITTLAIRFHVQKSDPFAKPEELERINRGVKTKLTELTKRFCNALCNFHRQTSVWKSELVEAIMDRPRYAYVILKDYEASFKPQDPKQKQLEITAEDYAPDPF